MRTARLRIVLRGGKCCDQVQGGSREVLWPCPWGKGGRCCDHGLISSLYYIAADLLDVEIMRIMLPWEVLWSCPWSTPLPPPPPPPRVEVTHACENITFARFATRAVIIVFLLSLAITMLFNVTPVHLTFTRDFYLVKRHLMRRLEVEKAISNYW